MIISIKTNAKTLLSVTKACLPDHLKVDETKSQIKSEGEIKISWKIKTTETGEYIPAVSIAAPKGAEITLSAGESVIRHKIQGTKGYFPNPEFNFERFELPGVLCLDESAGEIAVHIKSDPSAFIALPSIDLYPKKLEHILREEQALAANMRAEAAKVYDRCAQKGYGMMFHWTSQSCPLYGERKDYEQAVSDFDTEAFAEQAETAGASYVFLTANHAVRTFPAPLETWEEYFPGFTTKRDLIEDLYRSLEKRGIALMLYINFTAAYMASPYYGSEQPNDMDLSTYDHYTKLCVDIFNEIGNRYGEKIKGFWIDSCYQPDQQMEGYDFKPLYEAAKTGYADRLVSFNFWIYPLTTPWNDYWGGETARYADIPDEKRPSFGPAKGRLYHQLIIMEYDWGHFSNEKPIQDPYYSAGEIAAFAKKAKETGVMLTINAEVYQDGTMGAKTLAVLKEAKALLE